LTLTTRTVVGDKYAEVTTEDTNRRYMTIHALAKNMIYLLASTPGNLIDTQLVTSGLRVTFIGLFVLTLRKKTQGYVLVIVKIYEPIPEK
jgi:hypothetical protein